MMKKLRFGLLAVSTLLFLFVSCTNSSSTSDTGTNNKTDNESEEDSLIFKGTPYTEAGSVTINEKDYTLVKFGDWPQTIKADDVTVDENKSVEVGLFVYYKGSDGAWYAKCEENAFTDGLTYSDGTSVARKIEKSTKYFKVEPLLWRVLTTDFDHDGDETTAGKKLLFMEDVITTEKFDDAYNEQTVNGTTVYPNNYEYSKVRAYLNGLVYEKGSTKNKTAFEDKGFLQTAFTEKDRKHIVKTKVDNSSESFTDCEEKTLTREYPECKDTEDKLFLLSMREVTDPSFGFGKISREDLGEEMLFDPVRVRQSKDFAKAQGANNGFYGKGTMWWLRSPDTWDENDIKTCAKRVWDDGRITGSWAYNVSYGVVPALCLD